MFGNFNIYNYLEAKAAYLTQMIAFQRYEQFGSLWNIS